MIYIKDLMSGIDIFKALSSEIRIQILELLATNQALNLNEIAKKLNLSNGAITMHIKKLEESGLIEINTSVGKHGIQKVCYLNKDKLMVDLRSKDVDNLYEVEIQVGHYSNYQAVPTCGLATKDSIIGDFDEPRYFADPQRIDSEIIWMAEGLWNTAFRTILRPIRPSVKFSSPWKLAQRPPVSAITILQTSTFM